MFTTLTISLFLFFAHPLHAAEAPDLEDQTRAIASELRCVVCQSLSVADSPSDMAQQMRGIIHEQLAAGKTPAQIKEFFVSKYGEWVLLAPATRGFSLLVWALPFVVLLVGIVFGLWCIRRWSAKKNEKQETGADEELLARVRSEAASDQAIAVDPENSSPEAQLLQERARLYAELKELDFDFQAGKLAQWDYAALKREVEDKAAAVLQRLDLILPRKMEADRRVGRESTNKEEIGPNVNRKAYPGWQLAAGGAFLLLFGLALGIALTNSLRPRESPQDSMTGGFLTGTDGGNSARFLEEGKSAFAKQDWGKAIEAFKQALAADPNQPEAHAYTILASF
jgi:cytochrome c-type biogenesis protein CcmH